MVGTREDPENLLVISYSTTKVSIRKSYHLSLLGNQQRKLEIIYTQRVRVKPVSIGQETHVCNSVLSLFGMLCCNAVSYPIIEKDKKDERAERSLLSPAASPSPASMSGGDLQTWAVIIFCKFVTTRF